MQEYFTNTFMTDNTNHKMLLTSGSPIPESYPEETRTSSGSNCYKTERNIARSFALHFNCTQLYNDTSIFINYTVPQKPLEVTHEKRQQDNLNFPSQPAKWEKSDQMGDQIFLLK